MVKIRNYLSTLIWVFPLVLVLLLIAYPLFHEGLFVSDDGPWMIIRLSAFFQTLKDGQFPTRFLGRLNYGYGYPVSNFLYPLFLYLGTVIHLVVKDYIAVFKILIGLSFFCGFTGMFVLVRTSFNRLVSVIASISFITSPYLLYTVFVRGSIGELLCVSLAPWILYFTRKGASLLSGILFGLLLLSHNSMAAIFSIMYILLLIQVRYTKMILSVIVGFGLASFFWIPALYEKNITQFELTNISNASNYWRVSLELYLVSVITPLLLLLFVDKKIKNYFSILKHVLVALLVVTTILGVSFTRLWTVFHFDTYLQFPFRIFGVLTLIVPVLYAVILSSCRKSLESILRAIILVISIVSILYRLLGIDFSYFPQGYYSTNESSTTVANEYMPRWVKNAPTSHVNDKVQLDKVNANYTLLNSTFNKITFQLKTKEETIVRINTIYYPGWTVKMNGVNIAVRYDNEFGLIEFLVPTGSHEVIVEFKETVERKIANSLSVVTGLSLIIYWCYLFYKNKQRVDFHRV